MIDYLFNVTTKKKKNFKDVLWGREKGCLKFWGGMRNLANKNIYLILLQNKNREEKLKISDFCSFACWGDKGRRKHKVR